MSSPSKVLDDGEELILDLRPHWGYFARETAALLVALAIGVVALGFDWPDLVKLGALVAILATLVWAGISYAGWASSHLVLTTDRLIHRSGTLTRTGTEIPLERINTVFFRQTLLERLLRCGDLTIESAGERGRQEFANIRRPLNVQNEIHRQMEASQNRRSGPGNHSPFPPSTIPRQIAELDELRRRGVVTDAEFQRKKDELLRRM